jgi:hypothetical protein
VVKNWYRETESTEADPLGTDAVNTIARKIMVVVGDPTLHRSIPVKVARALVERRVSPNEIAELCDIITAKRASRELERPGAYFITCVKRLFQRHEIPWRSPRPGPRTDLFSE